MAIEFIFNLYISLNKYLLSESIEDEVNISYKLSYNFDQSYKAC